MMSKEERYKKWMKSEQLFLWHELLDGIRRAVNGLWSIHCETVAARIVENARLIGAADPGEVHFDLVAGGIYEILLDKHGVPHLEIDFTDPIWINLLDYIKPETPESTRVKYAQTAEVLKTAVLDIDDY